MRASLFLPSFLVALAGPATPPSAAPPAVHLPDGAARPAILEQVELSTATRAFDVAPDGTRAAVATARGAGKDTRSILQLVSRAGPAAELQIAGDVLDLLFAADGSEIFVLQQRPATKKRSASCLLLRLDAANLESRRETYLPASARSLSYWAERDALLIVAQNEVRSLLLPGLRSGPLFRIPGDNRAVVVIGGSRALVGQAARLLWIDLDDPPGHDEMPVRAALAVESPVVDLASGGDGSRGLARLADDRVLRVTTEPLALEERGAGFIWGRAAHSAAPTPVAAPPAPRPAAPPVVPREPAPRPVEPPVAIAAEPQRRPAEAAASAASATGEPQLSGALSGPAAAAVVAVVFYGPNNILREARRVVPRPDGSFEVRGLELGRYRVVPDGGGSRVLVTEPPFHVLDLGGATAPAPLLFHVVRRL